MRGLTLRRRLRVGRRVLRMRPAETESEAARLLHDDSISDRAIAHATGTTAQLVCDWSAGRATPSDEQAQRLRALSSVVERLGRVIDPSLISAWLVEPIPALDGDSPLDRIASGDDRALTRLISGLEDPGAT